LTLNASAASATDEVFTVYNENIQPAQTATVAFSDGFGLPGAPGTPTDFVLNEGEFYEGSMVHAAEIEPESIPFQLTFGQDTTSNTATALNFEWRPDPALYLAVLTGQFDVHLIDSGSHSDYVLDLSVHVSGWKSILGSKKKKRRHKRRRKVAKK
jgi:hypothetical protein